MESEMGFQANFIEKKLKENPKLKRKTHLESFLEEKFKNIKLSQFCDKNNVFKQMIPDNSNLDVLNAFLYDLENCGEFKNSELIEKLIIDIKICIEDVKKNISNNNLENILLSKKFMHKSKLEKNNTIFKGIRYVYKYDRIDIRLNSNEKKI